jgi:carbon-monoxide dehydrogenase small subunit
MLAASAEDEEITTIEGVANSPLAAAVQRAFGNSGGAQCGYCTPGMVLAAKALLDAHPQPTDEDIRNGLSGNICRCTGYMQIFQSVKMALAEERDRRRAAAALSVGL